MINPLSPKYTHPLSLALLMINPLASLMINPLSPKYTHPLTLWLTLCLLNLLPWPCWWWCPWCPWSPWADLPPSPWTFPTPGAHQQTQSDELPAIYTEQSRHGFNQPQLFSTIPPHFIQVIHNVYGFKLHHTQLVLVAINYMWHHTTISIYCNHSIILITILLIWLHQDGISIDDIAQH